MGPVERKGGRCLLSRNRCGCLLTRTGSVACAADQRGFEKKPRSRIRDMRASLSSGHKVREKIQYFPGNIPSLR